LKSLSNTSASTPTFTATPTTFRAFSPLAHSPTTPSHPPSVDTTIRDPSNTNHRLSNTHAAPGTHTASSPPNILKAESGMSAPRGNGAASPLSVSTSGNGGEAGLDEFDFASFDFASPASWEALGKMWQTTYGCMPAGEQLMTFVVTGGAIKPEVGKPQAQAQQPQQPPVIQQLQSWAGSDQQDQPYADYGGYGGQGRGRGGTARGGFRGGYGGGRGRGGYQGHTYENSHGPGELGHQSNWGYDDQGTDAIVLGGGDESSPPLQYSQTLQYGMGGSDGSDYPSGGEGGKMQRVGDKWLFVKPEST
jgi:protein NRD1